MKFFKSVVVPSAVMWVACYDFPNAVMTTANKTDGESLVGYNQQTHLLLSVGIVVLTTIILVCRWGMSYKSGDYNNDCPDVVGQFRGPNKLNVDDSSYSIGV